MVDKNKHISRKDFIAKLGWLFAIPYMLIAGYAFKQNAQINRAKNIRMPLQLNKGVTFRDGLIVVKNDKQTQFLSAKCTHLGCNIHSVENGELICPCHGSRFSLEGSCLKGPAKEGLQVLEYEIDDTMNEYIIKI